MNVISVADDILIVIDEIPSDDKLTARQRERNAERGLIRQLAGNDVTLTHDKSGKPLLEGFNISISHTLSRQSGFLAVMLSRTHEVGIDIEYKSDRVLKIARRFLRDDEKPVTVDDHLVCWCAKEAVFKLFSADDLGYQEMRVSDDLTEVENIKKEVTVRITSIVNDDFVLVYTYL